MLIQYGSALGRVTNIGNPIAFSPNIVKFAVETGYHIRFGEVLGFEVADIKDFSVALTLDVDPAETVTKTLLTGGVFIIDNIISFILTDTDITHPGKYKLKVVLTDQLDNRTRITPCPNNMRFF